MACSSCGSVFPCGCSSGCSSSCGCGSGLSSSSCCGNQVPATAQPYYACAPACPEDHTAVTLIQQFYTAIKIANSWNVPECGQTAEISIPGVKNVVIGSNIWNEEFGYFEITAFNASTQKATIINNCIEGNAAPGTNVPSCSEFIVTDPPVETPGENTPCVAIDFTAPDVGSCLDITLTSTEGLSVGDSVQIGTGIYRLAEIKANNIVNICNDGEGITPGTPVIAKDANDNFQYCLSIIAVDPCDIEAVNEAVVIGCADGQLKPINVPGEGWILYGIDADTNEAAYRPLGEMPHCTVLTNVLNITTGDDTYTLTVGSTGAFTVGEILTIDSYAGRLEITGISDATHMDVTVTPMPGSNASFAAGTVLCTIGCCEQNSDYILSIGAISESYTQDPVSTGALDSGSPSLSTPVQTITINNVEDIVMDVFFTIEAQADVDLVAVAPDEALYSLLIFMDFDDPTPTTQQAVEAGMMSGSVNGLKSSHLVTSNIMQVGPNSSRTINYIIQAKITNILNSPEVTVTQLYGKLSLIGVSL